MKVLQTEIEKNKYTRRKSDRFTERGRPKGGARVAKKRRTTSKTCQ